MVEAVPRAPRRAFAARVGVLERVAERDARHEEEELAAELEDARAAAHDLAPDAEEVGQVRGTTLAAYAPRVVEKTPIPKLLSLLLLLLLLLLFVIVTNRSCP